MIIPHDKIDHFVVGIAMDAVLRPLGNPLASYFDVPTFVGQLVVATCVVVIAVGKERLWDARGHGTSEANDALATVLGCLCLEAWLEAAARWL